MPSEHKLPDGRWRVFVAQETPGGRLRANATRETLREARKAASDALGRKVKVANSEARPGELLRDLMADHHDLYVAVHLSPSTARGYEGIRRRHAEPALGHLRLEDVTPTALLRYQAAKTAAVGPVTVEHHMSYLRGVLAFGVRTKRVEWNAAEAVKAPHKPRARRRRALTLDELAAVLAAAEELRDREPKRKGADPPDLYGPLLIAACSGLRRGELLALRWSDVDRETGVLTARESLVKPVGAPLVRKGTKATAEDVRVVLLPAIALQELVAEHRRQSERRLREPGWNSGQVVFCDRGGRAAAHQVARCAPHLRHSRARGRHERTRPVGPAGPRHGRELGADITIIRGRQGHSDVRMTERYVHDTVKVQKPAVARLNRALARKLPSHSPTH